jgi:uncharacterized heparinase superfamily protein
MVTPSIDSAKRFFAGAVDRARMQALFATEYHDERDAAIAEAERVIERRVAFFGQQFQLSTPVAWNCDPVTGVEWPRRYHRDVPIHGGNIGYGDVKYVWELNRHQFLIDLGRASFLSGDRRYALAAKTLLVEWIADNPYGIGVNWACALEPAFRVFSWLWTYNLCLDHVATDGEWHTAWLGAFHDHGRFLHRHLEYYASPFNHLVGEASALYMLGVLFPQFEEAPAWRTRGRHVLESRLREQFYRDGGSVEQSTFYHHATLGFYLLALVLGDKNGDPFSRSVRDAIERALEFSMALTQPDGKVPAIGGADDGKPIRMEHLPFWDFRPYLAIGSVLFGRGDFKSVAGRFLEVALWLLGPEGHASFGTIPSVAPEPPSVLLRDSGYATLRSSWSPNADFVCLDCGEQAGELRTDAVPNSVHGHADALSVVVQLRGQPILVDSGLLCYNGEPVWEAHFRRTAAHNTARIDGADQALHHGKMAWSYSYRVAQEHWMARPNEAVAMASHDGYTRRGGDTVHRRLVWLRPGSYVVIYDEFECGREHEVELNFQFAPGELALNGQSAAVFNDDADMAWTASSPLLARTFCGGNQPDEGWIAPSLGVRVAAPRLRLTGKIAAGRSAVLTVLGLRPAIAVTTPGMISVVRDGHLDYIGAPVISRDIAAGPSGLPVVISREDRGRKAG